MRRRHRLTLAAVGILASGLEGQLPGQAPARAGTAVERTALGQKLYEGKGLCFSCHGKNGEGVLAPSTRLVGRALTHIKATVPEVVALIKAGVDSAHSTTGVAMPARGGSRLTDTEVDAVAWYVLELQKREKPH